MLVLFPKKIKLSSGLSKKELLKKLSRNMDSHNEKGILKVNKLIKKRFNEDLFYGSRRENAFTLFHHRPFKRDGGGVRFNGVVVDSQNGCMLAGYIRHSLLSYVFGTVWCVLLFMISVVLLVENPPYCLLTLGLMIAGIFIIWGDSKNTKYLRAFLEALCETEDKNKEL